VGWDVLTEAIELHRRGDASTCLGYLLGGGSRLLVLPGHEEVAAEIDASEWAWHEPDMEVGAPISPAVEVDAPHVPEREHGSLDPAADFAEGRRDLARHVSKGVEVIA
jgi:hypothetical protein